MAHEVTAYVERCNGGWLLTVAVPAEAAMLALEMLDDLVSNLRPHGNDAEVAAAAGSLVGLLDELKVRSTLDALTAARTAAA